MKSAAFSLHSPVAVEEAVSLLAAHAGGARVLAGGQSLVPLMHRRLQRPQHLVEVNRIPGLDRIEAGREWLSIGAAARQRDVENDPEVGRRWPLLPEAIAEVAHPAIRHRGTVLGSVCHADPSAELPSVAVALGGRVRAARVGAERRIPLSEFFRGPHETALEPDELALALELPAPAPRTGSAWLELARRGGDLPVAGVAAVVVLDPAGRCLEACAVCANAGPTPFDAGAELDPLRGMPLGEEAATAAGERVAAACSPPSDYQGSEAERRRLLAVLVRRALLRAAARAGEAA